MSGGVYMHSLFWRGEGLPTMSEGGWPLLCCTAPHCAGLLSVFAPALPELPSPSRRTSPAPQHHTLPSSGLPHHLTPPHKAKQCGIRLTCALATAMPAGGYIFNVDPNLWTMNGACAMFNVDSGVWSAAPSLPVAVHHAPMGTDGTSKVYIFGGRIVTAIGGIQRPGFKGVQVFDIATSVSDLGLGGGVYGGTFAWEAGTPGGRRRGLVSG